MLTQNVGVVIPYYQKESGILIKALNSIFQQTVENVVFHIVIVDDESPIEANNEILDVVIPENCSIELIEQTNAGPAKARNTALDYLSEQSIDLVAFLDSDDVWLDNHIAQALMAIQLGADFYCCDHKRFNTSNSGYEELEFFQHWESSIYRYGITLDKGNNFASLSGENCFSLMLDNYLSQTSTVVYSFNKLNKLRFDTSLISAGEDHLLWLELVSQCNKVIFSLNKNIYCGEGVNIYFDAFDWAKLKASSQLGYRYLFYCKVLSNFSINEKFLFTLKEKQKAFLYGYSYLMFKHCLLGVGINRQLIKEIIKLSPITALLIPCRFIRVFFNKQLLEKIG